MALDEIPEFMPLQTNQQWKAMSHPLRVGIMRLLIDAPLTNEELAHRLGVASGKLYFHTKTLRDAGLILLVGTREKGHLTEKLYRAAARSFKAPEPEKGGDRPPFETAVEMGLDLYRSSWQETGGLIGEIEGGFHIVMSHSPERQREFVERFRELFRDFQEPSGSDADGAATLALTMLIHTVPSPKNKS